MELAGAAPVRWYDDPETRLFVAAVSAYGRTLGSRGLESDARDCADFLLGLDPADRLNIEREIVGVTPSDTLRSPGR